MSVATFEGIVEQGQIKLINGVRLPDNIRVYIIVPELQTTAHPHIYSPRLAHPDEAIDFKMEVSELREGESDASV
jgi:hypothetical protein